MTHSRSHTHTAQSHFKANANTFRFPLSHILCSVCILFLGTVFPFFIKGLVTFALAAIVYTNIYTIVCTVSLDTYIDKKENRKNNENKRRRRRFAHIFSLLTHSMYLYVYFSTLIYICVCCKWLPIESKDTPKKEKKRKQVRVAGWLATSIGLSMGLHRVHHSFDFWFTEIVHIFSLEVIFIINGSESYQCAYSITLCECVSCECSIKKIRHGSVYVSTLLGIYIHLYVYPWQHYVLVLVCLRGWQNDNENRTC